MRPGLGHHRVHFRCAAQVMAQGDARYPARPGCPGLRLHPGSIPEGEDEPVIGLDGHDLAGGFPEGTPAEPTDVEAAGRVNTAHPQ